MQNRLQWWWITKGQGHINGDWSSSYHIESSSLSINFFTALGSAKSHFLRVKFDNEAPLFSSFEFFHCLVCDEHWLQFPRNVKSSMLPLLLLLQLPANQFNIILNGEKTNKYLLSFSMSSLLLNQRVSTGLNGKASGHTYKHRQTHLTSPQQIDRSIHGDNGSITTTTQATISMRSSEIGH